MGKLGTLRFPPFGHERSPEQRTWALPPPSTSFSSRPVAPRWNLIKARRWHLQQPGARIATVSWVYWTAVPTPTCGWLTQKVREASNGAAPGQPTNLATGAERSAIGNAAVVAQRAQLEWPPVTHHATSNCRVHGQLDRVTTPGALCPGGQDAAPDSGLYAAFQQPAGSGKRVGRGCQLNGTGSPWKRGLSWHQPLEAADS